METSGKGKQSRRGNEGGRGRGRGGRGRGGRGGVASGASRKDEPGVGKEVRYGSQADKSRTTHNRHNSNTRRNLEREGQGQKSGTASCHRHLVLYLHGRHQCSEIFSQKTYKVRKVMYEAIHESGSEALHRDLSNILFSFTSESERKNENGTAGWEKLDKCARDVGQAPSFEERNQAQKKRKGKGYGLNAEREEESVWVHQGERHLLFKYSAVRYGTKHETISIYLNAPLKSSLKEEMRQWCESFERDVGASGDKGTQLVLDAVVEHGLNWKLSDTSSSEDRGQGDSSTGNVARSLTLSLVGFSEGAMMGFHVAKSLDLAMQQCAGERDDDRVISKKNEECEKWISFATALQRGDEEDSELKTPSCTIVAIGMPVRRKEEIREANSSTEEVAEERLEGSRRFIPQLLCKAPLSHVHALLCCGGKDEYIIREDAMEFAQRAGSRCRLLSYTQGHSIPSNAEHVRTMALVAALPSLQNILNMLKRQQKVVRAENQSHNQDKNHPHTSTSSAEPLGTKMMSTTDDIHIVGEVDGAQDSATSKKPSNILAESEWIMYDDHIFLSEALSGYEEVSEEEREGENKERREMEIDSLEMIFEGVKQGYLGGNSGEDLLRKKYIKRGEMTSDLGPCIDVASHLIIPVQIDETVNSIPSVILHVLLPASYPTKGFPELRYERMMCCRKSWQVRDWECSKLLNMSLVGAMHSCEEGNEMLYQLVEATKEWLSGHMHDHSSTRGMQDLSSNRKTKKNENGEKEKDRSDSGDSSEEESDENDDDDHDVDMDTSPLNDHYPEELEMEMIRKVYDYLNRRIQSSFSGAPIGDIDDSQWFGSTPTTFKGFADPASSSAVGSSSKGWNHFCIGLVGKPSAGKSTFFNAVTDPSDPARLARVGAYPFTTIDPNMSWGYMRMPEPHTWVHAGSNPRHGLIYNPKTESYERRIPVRIKDVAGLVQGAYKGYGKGNAFLNDLLDADVLVHVVDASGMSDAGGNLLADGKNYDVSEDVSWIHEEIHRWIFNNVRKKWRRVRRFPQRFFELFGGYHCKPTVVWAALQQMGIASISELSARLPLFTRGELHLFIAHFLRIRFPVILCLNKCDTPTSLNQVGRVKARFPHYVGECVSARLACQLLKLRAMCEQHHSLPTCNHPFAMTDAIAALDCTELHSTTAEFIRIADEARASLEAMQKGYGKRNSGVCDVVRAAFKAKSGHLCYPVVDFKTLESPVRKEFALFAEKASQAKDVKKVTPKSLKYGAKKKKKVIGSSLSDGWDSLPVRGKDHPIILRESVMLQPTASVSDMHAVLKKEGLSSGDFIRGEQIVFSVPESDESRSSSITKSGSMGMGGPVAGTSAIGSSSETILGHEGGSSIAQPEVSEECIVVQVLRKKDRIENVEGIGQGEQGKVHVVRIIASKRATWQKK